MGEQPDGVGIKRRPFVKHAHRICIKGQFENDSLNSSDTDRLWCVVTTRLCVTLVAMALPNLMVGPKLLLTGFGIHLSRESCEAVYS